MSIPVADVANGVGMEAEACSAPVASMTTALMRVVPTSRPRRNPRSTGG
jgi:hypothetical protein